MLNGLSLVNFNVIYKDLHTYIPIVPLHVSVLKFLVPSLLVFLLLDP